MRLSIVAGLALLAIAAPARAGAAGCAVRAAPTTSEKRCAEPAAGAAPVARLRVAPAAANASDTLPLWLLPAGAAALVAVAFLVRRGTRA